MELPSMVPEARLEQDHLHAAKQQIQKRHKAMKAIRGFTLLELMMVVALISILTAIAIPTYATYRERGDRAQAQAALSSAATAMERFKMQRFTYNGATAGTAGTDTIPSQSPISGTVKYNIQFITAAGPTLAGTNTLATTYEIIATSTRAMDNSALKQEVLKINQQGQRCFLKGAGSTITNCTMGTDASW